MATPCTSIFTPWYLGSLEVPKEYRSGNSQFSRKSAYWSARNLARSVDMRYGDAVVSKLQKARSQFEQKEFAAQKMLEVKALELYKKSPDKARDYLTKYSSKKALEAQAEIESLYGYFEKR
jgi:dipeptidase